MVKLNYMRLADVLSNTKKNLRILDRSIEEYNKCNNELKDVYEQALRSCIFEIFKNAEDYLGMVLKKLGVGVTDKTFKDCINLAKDNKLINSEYADCIYRNIKIGNSYAHKYNVPSTAEIIKFYNSNKDCINKQITFMEDILKEHNRNSKIEELGLF